MSVHPNVAKIVTLITNEITTTEGKKQRWASFKRENVDVLKQRLLNRHQGQEKLIEKRMNKFNEEVSHWSEYNYIIVNDDLETCYNKILRIIKDEKKGIKQTQNLTKIKEKIKELTK